MIKIITYPLVFLWTTISGLTGMLLSVVLRLNEITLAFVPGKMWAPVLFWLLGIKVKIKGLENIDPYTPSIFVVNHASFLDILACVMKIPLNLNFIAKKELKKMPVVGWYIAATDQIFIDRKDKDKAMRSMQIAAEKIKKGKHVLTYPEGSRSKDGEVKMFRRGTFIIARQGDVPFLPVGIVGAHECLPPGKFLTKRGTIQMSIGTPIDPADYPDATPEMLAKMAQDQVIALRKELMANPIQD